MRMLINAHLTNQSIVCHSILCGNVTITSQSRTDGATQLSHMNLSGYVDYVSYLSRTGVTTAQCESVINSTD